MTSPSAGGAIPTRRRRLLVRGAIAAIALTPVLLSAAVASHFYDQARYNQQFRYYPFTWHAGWIQSPYHSGNVAMFRKELFVNGQVRNAWMVLAAHSFIDIWINGKSMAPFFNAAADEYRLNPDPIGGQATRYTALGYPETAELGHCYNLSMILHSGINVITMMVQTDRGDPGLVAEGSVETAGWHPFVSDASWMCSPYEQTRNGIPWTSPLYFDGASWLPSAVTGRIPHLPVDGDVTVLNTPMRAAYIGANNLDLAGGAEFRSTIQAPDRVVSGWLRISTTRPYDLVLDGTLIGTDSMVARYRRPLVVQGDNAIGLLNARKSGSARDYPADEVSARMAVYILKDVLVRGRNSIEVTLHPKEITADSALPTVYVDGLLRFADGTTGRVFTNALWQARVPGGRGEWSGARVATRPDLITPGIEHLFVDAKVTSAAGSRVRLLRNGVVLALLMLLAGFVVARLLGQPAPPSVSPMRRVGGVFMPPALVLAVAWMLQVIFAPSTQAFLFSSSRYAEAVLWVALCAWLAGVAALALSRRSEPAQSAEADLRRPFWRLAIRHGPAVAMCLMLVAAAVFTFTGLRRNGFIPDEYVSLLAARGILRTGLPLYQKSGILYPRSSLYHYLLAPFEAWGYHTGNLAFTRVLSGLWHLALIVVTYLFGRELKDRRTGLLAAALIAFSPYALYYAREVRFYSQFAFFSTLTFYLLLKSVRNPDNDRYRFATLLAYMGGYLSQEIMFTAIPAMMLVVLLAGQGRLWLKRWVATAMVAVVVVMSLDLWLYFHYCVTALPWVDVNAYPLLAFHVDDLDLTTSILLTNNERAQIVIGILVLGGALYLLYRVFTKPTEESAAERPWRWWNYLYVVTLAPLFVLTIISPHPASRYAVGFIALTGLIAACMAREIGSRLARWFDGGAASLASRYSTLLYAVGIVCVAAAAYRPLRTLHADSRTYDSSFTSAAHFIEQHRKPGDKIMAFNPEVAMVELDQCDYFWRPYNQAEDKYIADDGRLRERDSGAVVIDNVDKLRWVISHYPRVWLIFPPRNLSASHYLPVNQLNSELSANFRVVFHSLNCQVWLWDASLNHYRDRLNSSGMDQIDF
ncbi:MAG: glycosyltransferase family 39 protein [Armatimonadetes bacterium]|nr:glycosyltransferase family 39 protein [Armatimonadota bacterium]MDE2206889.1 glycosyltransferase family 39 protein [Armatimonadota bacterium]